MFDIKHRFIRLVRYKPKSPDTVTPTLFISSHHSLCRQSRCPNERPPTHTSTSRFVPSATCPFLRRAPRHVPPSFCLSTSTMITPTTTYMTVFIAPPNVVCPCFDRPSSLLLTLHASGAEVVDARLAAVVRDARRKEFQAFVASQLFRRRHADERVPLFAARGALRQRPFVRVRRGIRLLGYRNIPGGRTGSPFASWLRITIDVSWSRVRIPP